MPAKNLDVFSVRDLRLRSSELVRDAEAGRVSIITKRGRPSALTVPFGRRLLELGVDKDLALIPLRAQVVDDGKSGEARRLAAGRIHGLARPDRFRGR